MNSDSDDGPPRGPNNILSQSPIYPQSFLSPSVRYRLTSSLEPAATFSSSDFTNVLINSSDLTLNWDGIEQTVSPHITKYEINDDVLTALGSIAQFIYTSIKKQLNKDPSVVQSLYNQYSWTQCQQLYIDCLECVLMERSTLLDVHLCLLLCTAAIERSLGDLYINLSKGKPCPKLLKDLLAMKELEVTLGTFPMFCLKCLIGPPTGFNLRNVVWHGFFAEGEIPKQLVLFLLLVFGSLSQSLVSQSSVPHRPYVHFPQQESVLHEVFPDKIDIDAVAKLFNDTVFIAPSMKTIWQKTLEYFRIHKYGEFISMTLPCLEHSLRCVFARSNRCPERIITAESNTLYTTFDEILSQTLEDGHQLNQFPSEVGTTHMELLLDLLVHPEGLRLRDRISHGEVCISAVPRTIANFVLGIVVSFCAIYSRVDKYSDLGRIIETIHSYCSLFHPIALLNRELLSLLVEMSEWSIIKTYHLSNVDGHLISVDYSFFANYQTTLRHLLHQFSPGGQLLMVDSMVINEQCFDTQPLQIMVEAIWRKQLPLALHINSYDLEIIGLLRRTIDHLMSAVKQILLTVKQRYTLYCDRSLRSRQRANFNRLLSNIGLYWSSVLLVCILVCMGVACFPTPDVASDKTTRFFKKVLQFAENFHSQSLPVRNRWDECEKHCSVLVEQCNNLHLNYSQLTNIQ